MTDYAAILASNAAASERAQQIADLFNASANPHPYIEFRLGYIVQQNAIGRQVFALEKSQVDGTVLAAAIAEKSGKATPGDAEALRTEHKTLAMRHQQNKAELEKTAGNFQPLREAFDVMLAAEQKMKNWADMNLSNTVGLVKKIAQEIASVQEMQQQLAGQGSMLEGLGNSLQNMKLDIWRRGRRAELGSYLKNGIATGNSLAAPKTARFARRATKVQP